MVNLQAVVHIARCHLLVLWQISEEKKNKIKWSGQCDHNAYSFSMTFSFDRKCRHLYDKGALFFALTETFANSLLKSF